MYKIIFLLLILFFGAPVFAQPVWIENPKIDDWMFEPYTLLKTLSNENAVAFGTCQNEDCAVKFGITPATAGRLNRQVSPQGISKLYEYFYVNTNKVSTELPLPILLGNAYAEHSNPLTRFVINFSFDLTDGLAKQRVDLQVYINYENSTLTAVDERIGFTPFTSLRNINQSISASKNYYFPIDRTTRAIVTIEPIKYWGFGNSFPITAKLKFEVDKSRTIGTIRREKLKLQKIN